MAKKKPAKLKMAIDIRHKAKCPYCRKWSNVTDEEADENKVFCFPTGSVRDCLKHFRIR